jgi:hypothetical protein
MSAPLPDSESRLVFALNIPTINQPIFHCVVAIRLCDYSLQIPDMPQKEAATNATPIIFAL